MNATVRHWLTGWSRICRERIGDSINEVAREPFVPVRVCVCARATFSPFFSEKLAAWKTTQFQGPERE